MSLSHTGLFCVVPVKCSFHTTSIGVGAFVDCTSLTSVTIGNGVTSIGSSAFYNCTSIKYNTYSNAYYLGNSKNPYHLLVKADDTSITSCTINKNTKLMYGAAFSKCAYLKSITISDSVTTLESDAFNGCTSLTSVNYLGTIEQWCNITIGNFSANPLSNGAKLYLKGKLVTKLVIPDTVTEINVNAFRCCTSLTSVIIPDSVTSIGSSAFRDCTSLASITISDSVTSIGSYAFYGCTGLTEINFNATAMKDLSKDNYVFYNAGKNGKGITVNIGSNVAKIPAYLFYPYNASSSPKIIRVKFEEGSVCKSIGECAFVCTSLTSITIPDSVTSIGNSAFASCASLTSITIGEGVTSMGTSAFYNCTSLASITIPDSVTSIGRDAFEGCKSLKSVTFKSKTGWYVTKTYGATSGTSVTVTSSSTNAEYLKSTYCNYYWYRK